MNAGQFIQWHDLFVVIDNGLIPMVRYGAIESAMRDQARLYPQGIVCFVVLPADTRPPPDDIKRAVKTLLNRLAPSISALSYVIEGTGFKGVAVRATLVGMKIFASRPYPIYVEVSMPDAIRKVLPHLNHGRTVTTDVNAIAKMIADARASSSSSPDSGREGASAK